MLFVDEVSRVARNQYDGAKLIHFVDATGLRVVATTDNIDTETDKNWQKLRSLKLMIAVHQNQSTAAEVKRGMLGQLERGYMIAQAPIGYCAERVKAADGRRLGTVWHVEERSTEVIRLHVGQVVSRSLPNP